MMLGQVVKRMIQPQPKPKAAEGFVFEKAMNLQKSLQFTTGSADINVCLLHLSID